MKRMMISLFMTSCVVQSASRPNVLYPEVTHGSAPPPRKAIMTQPQCGSLEDSCPSGAEETVKQIVSSKLEFAGIAIVDEATLVPETIQRDERIETNAKTTTSTTVHDGAWVPESRTTRRTTMESTNKVVNLSGSRFVDLPPAEQSRLMREAQTDGFVSVRIILGGYRGIWVPSQRVEVVVKLGGGEHDETVWVSRCQASGNYATANLALEEVTRCAMQGAVAN